MTVQTKHLPVISIVYLFSIVNPGCNRIWSKSWLDGCHTISQILVISLIKVLKQYRFVKPNGWSINNWILWIKIAGVSSLKKININDSIICKCDETSNVWLEFCPERVHGVFTRGAGSLWKFIFWLLQGAEDLHLTQSQWYVRVEYSHSTTNDPTTIQGHQRLGTAGDA